MMDRLKKVLSKDIKECLRTGKILVFLILAFGIALMIMMFTVVFTNIPDVLTYELAGFNIEDLEDMMKVLYPKMMKESLGVFSYYIGVFYSLIVIIISHAILSKEIKRGNWILPIQKGYQPREFLISKCIIYGSLAAASVFVSYMFYYFVSFTFMERNITFGNAFLLAIIHGLNLFFIVSYTILISVSFKSPIIGAISMIATVMFVPDLLNYFPFAKYLPTYSLNFVYESRADFGQVLAPIIFNLILLGITYVIADTRVNSRLSKS